MLVRYTGKFGRGVFGQRMEHDDTKEVTAAEWTILEKLGEFELVDVPVIAKSKRVTKKTSKHPTKKK